MNSKQQKVLKLIKRISLQIYIALFLLFLLSLFCYYIAWVKEERERFLRDYDFNNSQSDYFSTYSDFNVDEFLRMLAEKQKKMNMQKQVYIWNENVNSEIRFNKKATLIMVVQVHNRPLYLWQFLKYLTKCLGSLNMILILSHDHYDEEINNHIREVQFLNIIQIFYPYSRQLYPNIFPGDDNKYCIEGWRCKEDKEGRRNSAIVQMKHHWWWILNYVFDKLESTRFYNDLIVFLDEGQLVTEDFLYVVRLMEIARKSSCHRCDMLSVGAYQPVLTDYTINSTLLVEEFGSTPLTMGIAFNRTTWNRIKKLRRYFCYYDDADWVSSLRFLSSRLPEGRLNMLSIIGARVIHFGKCGVWTNNSDEDCDVTDKLAILDDFMDTVRSNLFPKHFVMKTKKRYTNLKASGNFGDVRDHELCMHFSK